MKRFRAGFSITIAAVTTKALVVNLNAAWWTVALLWLTSIAFWSDALETTWDFFWAEYQKYAAVAERERGIKLKLEQAAAAEEVRKSRDVRAEQAVRGQTAPQDPVVP